MRLLFVKDESTFLGKIKKNLDLNYIVDCVNTCEDCLFQIQINPYQLIIIDLDFSNRSFKLIQKLKKKKVHLPIFALGKLSSTPNIVQILKHGADDFLSKPFKWAEFNARIQALIRRSVFLNKQIVEACDFYLDTYSHLISYNNLPVVLKRKQRLILECLIIHYPATVTREILTAFAWKKDNVSRNIIDTHISLLRKNLWQMLHINPIKTIHGTGYKLENCRPIKNKDLVLWQ